MINGKLIPKEWLFVVVAVAMLGLTGWVLTHFDPTFDRYDSLILLLLPLAFGLAMACFPVFKSDLRVFTPLNLMLLTWLHKMVIIPIEIVLLGNQVAIFNRSNHPLFTEIFILIAAFFAFVAGWLIHKPPKSNSEPWVLGARFPAKMLVVGYLGVGIWSLFWLYGSLEDYVAGALFTYINREVMEQAGGALIGYLANVGQRFLPFGVIIAWCVWQEYRPVNIWYNTIWLVVCLLSTLSSNRANMIYPLLAFLSVMGANWYVKQKWLLVTLIVNATFLLFFFGYLRVQPTLDKQQLNDSFAAYIAQTDYIFYAHQIYFGTPYQITPLLHVEGVQHPTWWASLLDPVPILGKDFRVQSGVSLYNLAIYDSEIAQDKVVPVAGELFYNGGYWAVVVAHICFGWVYARLDFWFKNTVQIAPLLAGCFFYLALLFNATLLLNLSALTQFLIYNAAPALLLIFGYRLVFFISKFNS